MDYTTSLARINRYLLLHSAETQQLGLLKGKTGVAVFYYHYYRHTGNKLYADYAGELIDDVYSEIHKDYPKNFGEGLCGIGWALAYLIREGFIEADEDEILEAIDTSILEWNVKYVRDYSLETGLSGIAYYVIIRCANREMPPPSIPEEYIRRLHESLSRKHHPDKRDKALTEALDGILQ